MNNDKFFVAYTYVWLDAGQTIRSKTKILPREEINSWKLKSETITPTAPRWSFDGSSTGQATTEDSDLILMPTNLTRAGEYYDISSLQLFGDMENYVVLCEVLDKKKNPVKSNYRDMLMDEAAGWYLGSEDNGLWIGFEQEYVLWDEDVLLGSNRTSYLDITRELGQQYCDTHQHMNTGNQIANEHAVACINAGIRITGINPEVLMGQYEYQVFNKNYLAACDDLIVSRFILNTIANNYNLIVDYSPKPVKNQNGSGLHINFSTKKMRGLDYDMDSLFKALEEDHKNYMKVCGYGNEKRLTGTNETSKYDEFSYGKSNRAASIRIPPRRDGYLEDRRPGANANPYRLLTHLIKTLKKADL